VLNTAAQVKSLVHRDDNRIYPVRCGPLSRFTERLVGPPPCRTPRRIYVEVARGRVAHFKLGDVVEIEGFGVSGQFAPSIVGHRPGGGPWSVARHTAVLDIAVTGPDENARRASAA